MTHGPLYTIGYEGRGIQQFINLLQEYQITRLIDVREIPLSRKKGFSKTGLQERLAKEKIEYVHIRALGSPREIRHKLRLDSNYAAFFEAFKNHLSQNLGSVADIYQYLTDGINCIMCFESHPERCHRSTVAQKVKEHGGNGLAIKHIP